MSQQDVVRRFVLEGGAVRGQFVRLAASWRAMREHVEYPAPVRDLLGEASVAAVLLAATLKFDGTLTLQLQGNGAVRLLVVQCSDRFELRALARFDAAAVREDFATLVGNGQLTVTVETSARTDARYQGIVPLVGDSLAAALEHYCEQSEQLPTALRLVADDGLAAGLLLQRLPHSGGQSVPAGSDPDAQWQRSTSVLRQLDTPGLLQAADEDIARGCGAGDDVRLFEAHVVRFQCRCSQERTARVLRSLGAEDLAQLAAEQGTVTVTCEFCQKPWRFDAVDVAELLQASLPQPPGSTSVN